MGNRLTAVPQVEYYIQDLAVVVYLQTIGNGRLLKTIRGKHDEGQVVVKVYMKRPPVTDLSEYHNKLKEIRQHYYLIKNPNICPLQKFVETEKAAYLIRQYFASNLLDRKAFVDSIHQINYDINDFPIRTRPFLQPVEKLWVTFQLINAVSQIHRFSIYHGDIKCENVMLTSWDWVYLVDFAFYKPTFIPSDDPSDYSYFFDCNSRRTCNIAPERFFSGGQTLYGNLTPEMDIFSLGCVIAELFLDSPLFSYPELLSYIKGEFDPNGPLERIENQSIRIMTKSMISKDPSKRGSAKSYLEEWSKTLPAYFFDFHDYISALQRLPAEHRICAVNNEFEKLKNIAFGRETLLANTQNQSVQLPTLPKEDNSQVNLPSDFVEQLKEYENELSKEGMSLLMDTETLRQNIEADSLLLDTLNSSLLIDKSDLTRIPSVPSTPVHFEPQIPINQRFVSDKAIVSPMTFIQQKLDSATQTAAINNSLMICEGLVIIFATVSSCFRDLRAPTFKLVANELLLKFGECLDEDCRLQRIIPLIVYQLDDNVGLIRYFALSSLTKLLHMVVNLPSGETGIFPEYILPALSNFQEDPEELVRANFAAQLPRLAEVAKRFLERAQLFKQHETSSNTTGTGSTSTTASVTSSTSSLLTPALEASRFQQHHNSYDKQLSLLQKQFYDIVSAMFTKDCSSSVKRALLSDLTRLAVFFGRRTTNEFLLPLIITFLNDRDWELRRDFFDSLVGISTFVGQASLESFIYPCILQSLVDEEEFVVEKVLNTLASLCELGLFQKRKLHEISQRVSPMLLHPNIWIRNAVIAVISSIAKQTNECDLYSFLIPTIRPFLHGTIVDVNEATILESLLPALPRHDFERALKVSCDILFEISQNSFKVNSTPNSTPNLNQIQQQQQQQQSPISGTQISLSASTPLPIPTPTAEENLPSMIRRTSFMTADIDPFFRSLDTHPDLRDLATYDRIRLMASYLKSCARSHSSKRETTPYVVDDSAIEEELRSMSQTCPVRTMILHSSILIDDNLYNMNDATPVGSTSSLTAGSSAGTLIAGKNDDPTPISLKVPVQSHFQLLPQLIESRTRSATTTATSTTTTTNGDQPSNAITIPLQSTNSSIGFNLSMDFNSTPISPITTTVNPSINTSVASSAPTTGGAGPLTIQYQPQPQHPHSLITQSTNPNALQSFLKRSTDSAPKRSISAATVGSSSITSSITTASTASLAQTPGGGSSSSSGSVDLPDFGRLRRIDNLTSNPLEGYSLKNWRPQGILVANLQEHKKAVNQIQVSRDNQFFVTCSDDCTVKIWDCQQLEKNVTNRSRRTYSQGSKINCITLLENSHTIASGSDNGSIHIFRVDYTVESNSMLKYTSTSLLQSFESSEGPVVAIDHFNQDLHSMLVYATNRGKIHAQDLRMRAEAWCFSNPSKYGRIETMLIEPNHNWIIIGTSRGCYACWDTRFGIPVRVWNHPDRSPIHKIAYYNNSSKGRSFFYAAAGNNQVYLWDIESGLCRNVYRVLNSAEEAIAPAVRPLPHLPDVLTDSTLSLKPLDQPYMNALYTSLDCPFLLTGGTDKTIRYWDSQNIQNSYVVNGPPDHLHTKIHKYRTQGYDNFYVYEEYPEFLETRSTAESRIRISTPQPNHHDCIRDIKALELPFKMLVSGSRDGVVKVWR